jgi:hypothetical protein
MNNPDISVIFVTAITAPVADLFHFLNRQSKPGFRPKNKEYIIHEP